MSHKVALVTGASRGIGKEIALKLLSDGYIVYGVARNKEKLNRIESENPSFFGLTGDITDELFLFETIKSIKKNHKKLDCLVNNAAIEYNERIELLDSKHLEEMFNINVFSILKIVQLSIRIMKENSSIVNISSNVGLKGNPGQIGYAATKGAVNAITLTAAKELAAKGIRVNAVLPGLTNTEMLKDTDSIFLEERIKNIMLGKLVEPTEVADLVAFLCSDSAKMISGQLISVDGCTII